MQPSSDLVVRAIFSQQSSADQAINDLAELGIYGDCYRDGAEWKVIWTDKPNTNVYKYVSKFTEPPVKTEVWNPNDWDSEFQPLS